MPGTIRGAFAVDTFPISLSTKFVETRTCMPLINEYRDGSTQRSTLVTEARRSWSLAKRLTVSELATLRTFWEANPNTAFGFYNPFETSPPFTRTPFGTTGYYIVKFASEWEETIGMARSNAAVELIEVSSAPAGAPATIQGAIDQTLHGAVTSATLRILSSHTQNSGTGVLIGHNGLSLFDRGWFGGSGDWTLRTDSTAMDPNSILGLSELISFNTAFPAALSPPEELLIYDVWIEIVFADATSRTLRPQSYSILDTSQGSIANPGNAIDVDISTFATLTKTGISTIDLSPALALRNFA